MSILPWHLIETIKCHSTVLVQSHSTPSSGLSRSALAKTLLSFVCHNCSLTKRKSEKWNSVVTSNSCNLMYFEMWGSTVMVWLWHYKYGASFAFSPWQTGWEGLKARQARFQNPGKTFPTKQLTVSPREKPSCPWGNSPQTKKPSSLPAVLRLLTCYCSTGYLLHLFCTISAALLDWSILVVVAARSKRARCRTGWWRKVVIWELIRMSWISAE